MVRAGRSLRGCEGSAVKRARAGYLDEADSACSGARPW